MGPITLYLSNFLLDNWVREEVVNLVECCVVFYGFIVFMVRILHSSTSLHFPYSLVSREDNLRYCKSSEYYHNKDQKPLISSYYGNSAVPWDALSCLSASRDFANSIFSEVGKDEKIGEGRDRRESVPNVRTLEFCLFDLCRQQTQSTGLCCEVSNFRRGMRM